MQGQRRPSGLQTNSDSYKIMSEIPQPTLLGEGHTLALWYVCEVRDTHWHCGVCMNKIGTQMMSKDPQAWTLPSPDSVCGEPSALIATSGKKWEQGT